MVFEPIGPVTVALLEWFIPPPVPSVRFSSAVEYAIWWARNEEILSGWLYFAEVVHL